MALRHLLVASLLLAPAADAATWGSFDSSRISYSNGVFTTSPLYSDLRSKVVSAGGSIAPATATLTPAYLHSIDVFYTSALDIPNGTLSPAEQAALVEWVNCGGTLIVTAEYATLAQNDSFLAPFGITTSNSGASGAATVVQSHPVVDFVTSITYFAEAVLSPNTAQVLMHSAIGKPFVVVQESASVVGLGRVLALGDHTAMVDTPVGSAEQLRKNIAIWAEIPPPPACPNDTATWSNYGAGWPGTNGVPQIKLDSAPVLGEVTQLALENSSNEATTALMIFGAAPANLVSDLGGTLLVLPKVEAVFTLPPGGASIGAFVPCDTSLCGADLYIQAIQLDKGASHDLSFTPGLFMTFGS